MYANNVDAPPNVNNVYTSPCGSPQIPNKCFILSTI